MRRWDSILHMVKRYYPLSLPGTLITLLCLRLMAFGMANRNATAIAIALIALLIIGLSITGAVIQRLRIGNAEAVWDASLPVYARNSHSVHRLDTSSVRTLPFYRVHLKLRGVLELGNNADIRIYADESVPGGKTVNLPLYLPLSGMLKARVRTAVRDFFALSNLELGEEVEHLIPIRPYAGISELSPDIKAMSGFQEKNRKKQAEEERYFMREYMPGDRFRDINWKTSSRIATIITRIPPRTQEESRLLTILFRRFRQNGKENLDSVFHLDQIKGMLVRFMRELKYVDDTFIFQIETGTDSIRVETEEDILRVEEQIASLFYLQDPGYSEALKEGGGEVVIFSTPFDTNLGIFLQNLRESEVLLFRSTDASAEGGEHVVSRGLFTGKASVAILPKTWCLLRERGDLNGGSGKRRRTGSSKRSRAYHTASFQTDKIQDYKTALDIGIFKDETST